MAKQQTSLAPQRIASRIYFIRGGNVILDTDLAELYGIRTSRLHEHLRANPRRYPEDFVFQLSEKEFEQFRMQFATTHWQRRTHSPYAFTDYGIATISCHLRIRNSLQVTIPVLRTFERVRTHGLSKLKKTKTAKKCMTDRDSYFRSRT